MVDTRVSYNDIPEFMKNWIPNVCSSTSTEYHRIGGSLKTYHIRPLYEDIDRVIFHNPATIVFWKDGTKTVAKCYNENYDPEKGLMMAILKKFMTYNQLNKLREKYDEDYLPEKEIKSRGDFEEALAHFRKAVENSVPGFFGHFSFETKGEDHEKDDVD